MSIRSNVFATALAAMLLSSAITEVATAGDVASELTAPEAVAYCASTCTASQQIIGCDDRE
ncbi:MAG: hypothetical protein ACREYE_32555 [Gammaproteobacteria bacterium]